MLGVTLRYPYEVRKEEEYFDDIPEEKIPKDMLDLASHIVKTKTGHFEPSKFKNPRITVLGLRRMMLSFETAIEQVEFHASRRVLS